MNFSFIESFFCKRRIPSLLLFAFVSVVPCEEAGEKYGSGNNGPLDIYQQIVSPARGSHCPMYPSCSQYAKQAFHQMNPVDAFFAASDRLLRCGQDLKEYPARYVGGYRLAYDPVPSSVQSKIPSDADTLTPLLTRLGMDDLALLEFLREYSRSDSKETREKDLRGMMACLRAKGDYQGMARLHRYVNANEAGMDGLKSAFFLEEAAMLTDSLEYGKALTTLRLSGLRQGDSLYARSRLAACINLARLERWGEIAGPAAEIRGDSRFASAAKIYQALPDAVSRCPRKSPGLAGWLSALAPGSGYAYVGRPGTAFAAFVINGLFIWTVTEALTKKNYAIAATATVLGSGWYGGGIRGSYRSALEYNYKARRSEVERAERSVSDVWNGSDSTRSDL